MQRNPHSEYQHWRSTWILCEVTQVAFAALEEEFVQMLLVHRFLIFLMDFSALNEFLNFQDCVRTALVPTFIEHRLNRKYSESPLCYWGEALHTPASVFRFQESRNHAILRSSPFGTWLERLDSLRSLNTDTQRHLWTRIAYYCNSFEHSVFICEVKLYKLILMGVYFPCFTPRNIRVTSICLPK